MEILIDIATGLGLMLMAVLLFGLTGASCEWISNLSKKKRRKSKGKPYPGRTYKRRNTIPDTGEDSE